MKNYRVDGRVTSKSNQTGLADLRVEAWDQELIFNELVASAVTASDGTFTITFTQTLLDRLFFDRAPLLFFKIYRGDILITNTRNQLLWDLRCADVSIVIEVDETVGTPPQGKGSCRVYGTIRDANGNPLAASTVQAFARTLRNLTPVGAATSEADGSYSISYDRVIVNGRPMDDLQLKVLDAAGKLLVESAIQFQVPAQCKLDLMTDGATYAGPSQWETLTAAIDAQLDGVAPVDLQENNQYQDITFLASELKSDRLTIGTWVACWHLSAKCQADGTPLAPEIFFAFLRQGQPSILSATLLDDIAHPDLMLLLQEKILTFISGLPADTQQTLLSGAVDNQLVPLSVRTNMAATMQMLVKIKAVYAGQITIGGGKGTVNDLLTLTPAAAANRDQFVTALNDFVGPMSAFWKQVETDKVYPPDVLAQVKLSFEVGSLTRNHVPLVGVLVNQFNTGTLKFKSDLARKSVNDWVTLFKNNGPDGKPIGVPANTDGTTDSERYRNFAAILVRQLAGSYPTTAFAANLGRASGTNLMMTHAEVLTFLNNNPKFELDRYRIDHYVAQNPGALNGIKEPTAMLADLKQVQRVFKLAPSYVGTSLLMGKQITSAQKVYFMGQSQFVTSVTGEQINKLQAKSIYRKAENAYAMALYYYGNFNAGIIGVTPLGLGQPSMSQDTENQIKAISNLQTLFGTMDYCECTECRAIDSPAAYFVDVLRFLGERRTQGTTINAGKSVRDVLLERRPDLGEIELSCENTNTAIPYIDLVNEILEDVVAPPVPVVLNDSIEAQLVDGPIQLVVLNEFNAKSVPIGSDAQVYAKNSRDDWAVRDDQQSYKIYKNGANLELLPTRQSSLPADALRANPQYTNGAAYDTLAKEVYPFNLPFNLWLAQTRAQLAQLGVPHPQLLELLQQTTATAASPTQVQLDCAWLGVSDSEYQVLTGTMFGKNSWDYWGLAQSGNSIPNPDTPTDSTTNISGAWIDVLSHVDVMLNRAELTYTDLLQLLDTRYVNPQGAVIINVNADTNTADCDTSTFDIQGLTQDTLDRMHRFVRLWRILGCSMWDLDRMLPNVSPSPTGMDKRINDAALHTLNYCSRLQGALDLDWQNLFSLYNGIDTYAYQNYAQDATPPVQTLYQKLFLNKLVDAVATFPAAPSGLTGTIESLVPGILAALQLNESDLALILTDIGKTSTDNLTADVLNRIYRIPTLAQAMGMSVDSFLRLKGLWAQDPFSGPDATWRFWQVVQQVNASKFSVQQIDYLLRNNFDVNSGITLQDSTIASLSLDLRTGMQKIFNDLQMQSDDTPTSYVKRKLGSLSTLSLDADQTSVLAIIADTFSGAAAQRTMLITRYFTGVFSNMAAAQTELAALTPGLSLADRQTAVDARFAYVQPRLQAYLLTTQKLSMIAQTVATDLNSSVPISSALLSGVNLPGTSMTLMQALDDDRLIAKTASDNYKYTLDQTNFLNIYKAAVLLYKALMVTGNIGMQLTELNWWLVPGNAGKVGWMQAQDFPVDASAPISLTKWIALQTLFTFKAGLPFSDTTVFDFLNAVFDTTITSSQNIGTLSTITGWPVDDITSLVHAFYWLNTAPAVDVIKQQFANPASLARLADGMKVITNLGIKAVRAISWAVSSPDSTIADSIKQAIKSRYDLVQWQTIITPLQDDLRQRKCAALVSWLLAHPNQSLGQYWMTNDDLYAYFLIDVQMCSCMLTSRLKQAIASAQQFVQRCLLDLEQDLIASTALDDKWNQWRWMKLYRLWQANREVFLYPENWLRPELRTDKSPFFEDMMNELSQNDATADTALTAYQNYLDKLEQVSNLEIRAMFNQTLSADKSTMHVFGRSRSSSGPDYYYRQRINGARWRAWQKVDIDIAGDQLVSMMQNNRLYLAWPQFLDKADDPSSSPVPSQSSRSAAVPAPTRYYEIRMFWSELKQDKWSPKVLSNKPYVVYQSQTGGDNRSFVDFRVRFNPNTQIRVYASSSPANSAPTSYYLFDKIGRSLLVENAPNYEHLIAAPQSHYQNNMMVHDTSSQFFYYDVVDESGKPHNVGANQNAPSVCLLNKIPSSRMYTVIDSQAQGFQSTGMFATWNQTHTYTVDYIWLDYIWQDTQIYYSGVWHEHQVRQFNYCIHYHPFVELFIRELNIFGLSGLLNRQIQIAPSSIPNAPTLFDFSSYQPTGYVMKNYRQPDGTYTFPVEDVDFNYTGAYSIYNWELFFHVPNYIANKLATNQRFEEALQWYQYIFDPTNTDNTVQDPDTPQQKFWITKPFYETTKEDYYAQRIQNMMLAIARGDTALAKQVEEWRDNPFDPHLIAQMRIVAYQKYVLMSYIQTLISWGDQLFRQDTIETINEATQLYVLAQNVLGPRPKSIPRSVPNPIKTFYQLQNEIDTFGNALTEVENLLPVPSSGSSMGASGPELPYLNVLYFCIPNNQNMLSLWDTVADRLYKIRHCMNIQGIVQQLPLFEPPINPGMIIQAMATGLDLSSVLADMNAPMPLYRFTFVVQKAQEVCAAVQSLGTALLQALEKRDAEAFAQLRSSNEKTMLGLIGKVKQAQVDEAQKNLDAANAALAVSQVKADYYQKLISDGWSAGEFIAFSLNTASTAMDARIAAGYILSGGLKLIPQFLAGAAGFGGSPTVNASMGGQQIGDGAEMAIKTLESIASAFQKGASLAATVAEYERRADEWSFQQNLANAELANLNQQILAATIRLQIANQELSNHDQQITNQGKEDDFLHSKFTNKELYDWMLSVISTVYFQSYQLSYDMAKRAERCYRYELGLSNSNFIQFGYWDNLHQGLLAGDRLQYDLKRLEMAYYEQNERDYELTKHVSLLQLDPSALLSLRQNGSCIVNIPETYFDMDYPGQYFRRIKTVALTIPCVVGPYTTVACTLTMSNNSLRTTSNLRRGKYDRDTTIDDPRFRDEIAGIQSIATSTAQHDQGLFELNFHDDRYLPFEGAGAISSWQLKLNPEFLTFDYSTISDVIVHISYTAREGGDALRAAVLDSFNKRVNAIALAAGRTGLHRLFDLKREFPDQWYQFLNPTSASDDQALVLNGLISRLPYFTQHFTNIKVTSVEFAAQMIDGATYKVQVSALGTDPASLLKLAPDGAYAGLDLASKQMASGGIALGDWTIKIQAAGAADFKSLPANAISELFMNINYTIA